MVEERLSQIVKWCHFFSLLGLLRGDSSHNAIKMLKRSFYKTHLISVQLNVFRSSSNRNEQTDRDMFKQVMEESRKDKKELLERTEYILNEKMKELECRIDRTYKVVDRTEDNVCYTLGLSIFMFWITFFSLVFGR